MSRKDKQADLRRRMAEARSKLLQSQHPLPDDEEGSEEVGGNIVAGTRKRPLSPGGGIGGILRKSKYSTKTDAATQSSSSSHQNSLGALVDGYGESSSDDDDDDNRNKNRVVSSANIVTISTAPHPSQSTKKDESKHNYKPDDGNNNLNKSGSISKPASTKDDTSVSDEVWDEFNAMLEADEAASNDVINNTTTSRKDEKVNSKKSKEDDNDKETSPTSHNTEVKLNNVKKINKDDLYDNDDTNIMEQTSYEARLARLILLKNKKKKKKQSREMNEVASASTNLPSSGDFYDPSLAWAEDEEQEEDGEEVEKQINSGVDRDDEGEDGKTSLKQTTTMSLSSSAAVSMAKILRGRREEARMLASRGEDVANDGDLSQDMDASDGKWF
eukprot:scaffold36815_cov167-Skeletonema_dohrnii-CCMP3373.AAC.2